MSCWICLQGPAAMLDSAQAASFCTLALWCRISRGRTSRTPASTAVWVCRSEPLTTFPMERSAGVWTRSGRVSHLRSYLDGGLVDQSRRCYQDAQLLVSHQLHQPRHDSRLHHHVDAVVVAVRQVGDGPAGVGQDVLVGVVDQLDERRENLEETRLKVLQFT